MRADPNTYPPCPPPPPIRDRIVAMDPEQLNRIERGLAELKAAVIELVDAITRNTAEMNDLEDAAGTPPTPTKE